MTKRWTLRAAAAAALAGLLWLAPLVRVVPLSATASEEASSNEFDSKSFAADFWEKSLVPATQHATPAGDAVRALATDATQAKVEFGRTIGVGRSFFVFLQGEGDVVEVGRQTVSLKLGNSPAEIVQLSRGPIFGNAIRDASGLISVEDFTNSRDFNSLSTQLNQLAEDRIVPLLIECKVGDRIRFAGCGKIANPSRFKPPLVLAPILVEAP